MTSTWTNAFSGQIVLQLELEVVSAFLEHLSSDVIPFFL